MEGSYNFAWIDNKGANPASIAHRNMVMVRFLFSTRSLSKDVLECFTVRQTRAFIPVPRSRLLRVPAGEKSISLY